MKTFLKRFYPVIITLFVLPLIVGCGSSSSGPTNSDIELSAEDYGTLGDGNFHDYGTGDADIEVDNLDSTLAGYEGKYDDEPDQQTRDEDEKDEFSEDEYPSAD
jgi:hypothetical protein